MDSPLAFALAAAAAIAADLDDEEAMTAAGPAAARPQPPLGCSAFRGFTAHPVVFNFALSAFSPSSPAAAAVV